MTIGAYLTPRAFVALAAWQCLGIVGQWSEVCLSVYIGAGPFLLLIAWIDRRTLPRPEEFHISGTWPEIFELDVPVPLAWTITAAPVEGQAPAGLPTELTWQTETVRIAEAVPATGVARLEGDVWAFNQTLRPTALGTEAAPSPELVVRSHSKLWGRRFRLPLEAPAWRVIPSRERMPEQEFEQTVKQHRALFKGARLRLRDRSPDQYYTTRKYRFPDPIRHLDQKKTARYGEPMTRLFESLRQQHLVIALDLGRAMTGRIGASGKLAFYLAAAWTLIDVAIRSGDRVSFFAFARDVPLVIPRASALASFSPVSRGDARLTVRPVESDYRLVGSTLGALGAQRSLVVLLTDASRPSLQEELLASLRGVCRSHLTLALSLIDKAYDVDELALQPERVTDDEVGSARLAYSYWLREELELFRRRFTHLGGGLVTAPERHWLDMTQRVYGLLRASVNA